MRKRRTIVVTAGAGALAAALVTAAATVAPGASAAPAGHTTASEPQVTMGSPVPSGRGIAPAVTLGP